MFICFEFDVLASDVNAGSDYEFNSSSDFGVDVDANGGYWL